MGAVLLPDLLSSAHTQGGRTAPEHVCWIFYLKESPILTNRANRHV